MTNIGLITYHSAYNYGSVLQSYATQQAIICLGHNVEIINYRMPEQKYFYGILYHLKYGKTAAVRDILQFPIHRSRIQRGIEFEKFFSKYFTMTKELSEPEDVFSIWNAYDCIISGSDQIWNKDSIEFKHNDWKYMEPYLLKGYEGKKISYASSVGTLEKEKLGVILPYIDDFYAVSFREIKSTEFVSSILGRPIKNVLDPTFLLNREQWINLLSLKKKDGDYILYYSLTSYKEERKASKHLIALSEKYNCKVIVITPLNYVPIFDKKIEYRLDCGPIEFLELIYNAKMVVTYSYHGTVLSVNFEKPFYSLANKVSADYRKADILGKLGLSDRIAYGLDDVVSRKKEQIDYSEVRKKIENYRQMSIDYLRESLIK